MTTKTLVFVTLALAGVGLTAGAQPAAYNIDASHSSAQFSVRHMMISNVKGEFTKVTGTVIYDPKNPAASKINAVIDVNSINSRESKRDAHLKSPDFFHSAKYPSITFQSKQVWKSGGKLQAKGDLTMHGVTREVLLDVTGPTAEVKDPWGNQRFGASATVKINRKDWGLAWNQALETGGVMVGDDVTITIDIEATKAASASGGQ
ncbi:MAG: polyisoprenoid-binding protein [Acidobacteria bacterium]|nr:polyisoprenoid-binding protein [Acidobacteriota bacterium]